MALGAVFNESIFQYLINAPCSPCIAIFLITDEKSNPTTLLNDWAESQILDDPDELLKANSGDNVSLYCATGW